MSPLILGLLILNPFKYYLLIAFASRILCFINCYAVRPSPGLVKEFYEYSLSLEEADKRDAESFLAKAFCSALEPTVPLGRV